MCQAQSQPVVTGTEEIDPALKELWSSNKVPIILT